MIMFHYQILSTEILSLQYSDIMFDDKNKYDSTDKMNPHNIDVVIIDRCWCFEKGWFRLQIPEFHANVWTHIFGIYGMAHNGMKMSVQPVDAHHQEKINHSN